MSLKRIAGITAFGILFIAVVIGVMLAASYLRRDNNVIPLPEAPSPTQSPGEARPDSLDRVEITGETVQAVVSTLARPEVYNRDIVIMTFWEGGQAEYDISASTAGGVTALRILTPTGVEKRIIITEDTLYIWYRGDRVFYTRDIGAESNGDGFRTADEWQMIVTYEDILALDADDIIEAEYTEFGGEDCIYARYRSPLLGYTKTYYVSLELGLVTGAEEYDETGALVYAMSVSDCTVGATDLSAFALPDGTGLYPD